MTAPIVRSKHAIPDDAYRKMVLTLMDKQASREVATAEVFGQCVLHAPTIEDKIRITRFQHEELKHFQLLAKIMSDLGVDVDAYVRDRQRAGHGELRAPLPRAERALAGAAAAGRPDRHPGRRGSRHDAVEVIRSLTTRWSG